nr:u2 small nuclear ribonucleoprotein b'' [Quercus suber]
MLSGDIPPSQTIYIKNLNEKVKKEGEEFPFELELIGISNSSATTGMLSEWYRLSHSDGPPPSPPFLKLLMVSLAFVWLDTIGEHLKVV